MLIGVNFASYRSTIQRCALSTPFIRFRNRSASSCACPSDSRSLPPFGVTIPPAFTPFRNRLRFDFIAADPVSAAIRAAASGDSPLYSSSGLG